ncbi:hypothetical protein K3495_g13711, partial [Podosphaera aphanis]
MGSERVFRVPCKLANNGISVSILALPDSGAHGFCFLDRKIAKNICNRLGIVPIALPKPITPKGYDGIAGRIITHFLVTKLIIDGHILPQIPFLILDLGNQDAILGDAWMAHFDVLPDLKNKKLLWRTPPKKITSFQREIVVPRELLRPSPPSNDHQIDADRRDKAIRNDEKRASDGRSTRVLKPLCILEQQSIPVAIQINEKGPSTDSSKFEASILATEIPTQYHEFLDVFSKTASDIIAPRRPYDHKIVLKENAKMKYGPLYNQSPEELRQVKQYLVENLQKGWIEPSQAAYSSPVLFVKKPNGSLRFCVDYRKLNEITKKDRYPLPLIDETL